MHLTTQEVKDCSEMYSLDSFIVAMKLTAYINIKATVRPKCLLCIRDMFMASFTAQAESSNCVQILKILHNN